MLSRCFAGCAASATGGPLQWPETAQTDTEFYFCKGVALIAWALLLPDAVSAGDDFQAPEEISFDLHSNILQRDAQSSGALMYHMNTGPC